MTKSTFLFYTEKLTNAFNELIEDDEAECIATNGCGGGVTGLSYFSETYNFFNANEDEIEEVCCDMLGDKWVKELAEGSINERPVRSVCELKNNAVWFACEAFCYAKFAYLQDLALDPKP